MITKEYFDLLATFAARTGRRHPFHHLFAETTPLEKNRSHDVTGSSPSSAAREQADLAEIVSVAKNPSESPFAFLTPRETNRMTSDAITAAARRARSGAIPLEAPTDPTAIAILEAARVRDAGGHPCAEPTGLAKQILAAGKKRRAA
jgi:hypothetical protein